MRAVVVVFVACAKCAEKAGCRQYHGGTPCLGGAHAKQERRRGGCPYA